VRKKFDPHLNFLSRRRSLIVGFGVQLPWQPGKHEVQHVGAEQGAWVIEGGSPQHGEYRPTALYAIREIFEAERRKARRRLVALALVFLAILIAVIAGSALALVGFSNHIRADVRRLELAIAAAHRERGGTTGNDASSRNGSREGVEAQEIFRAQIETEGARTPPLDFTRIAMSLDELRRLQDLRSEYNERARKVDELAREAKSLVEAQQAFTDRRMAWRASHREFESRLHAEAARRRAAIDTVEELVQRLDRPTRSFPLSLNRASRSAAETQALRTSAWLTVEELNQLKYALALLSNDLDRLEREAVELEKTRREISDRSNTWRARLEETGRLIVDFRGRISSAETIPSATTH
jgi:predicted  nucleic acid-binding Zn-ribbon protein